MGHVCAVRGGRPPPRRGLSDWLVPASDAPGKHQPVEGWRIGTPSTFRTLRAFGQNYFCGLIGLRVENCLTVSDRLVLSPVTRLSLYFHEKGTHQS